MDLKNKAHLYEANKKLTFKFKKKMKKPRHTNAK